MEGVSREALVARVKAVLTEAYEEAAELVVEYLERHPGEQLQALCKEIDPDNWNALRQRVQRAQKAREAASQAGIERSRAISSSTERHVKSGLRKADPETVARIVADIPEGQRDVIVAAIVEADAPLRERGIREPRPGDLGWAPRAKLGKAMMLAASAWSEMGDDLPPDDEVRDLCIALAQKLGRYAEAIERRLAGDEMDSALAEWLEGAST